MNIEIKGSHARVVTSGVSDHLPISDDRLHNIFVNAFASRPTQLLPLDITVVNVRLHYTEAGIYITYVFNISN